ncbi:MAG: transglycosylase SLT domain-containing protein [bacterium]
MKSIAIIVIAGALAILIALWVDLRFEWACRKNQNWLKPCAARYGLPVRLVASVIWQESHFRNGKQGSAGELGLMQVTEAAGREWAHAEHLNGFQRADLLDARTNVWAGSWYLSRAVQRWHDRPDALACALAEYNAGLVHARRWAKMASGDTATNVLTMITFPSTRRYARDVLRRARCGVAAPAE